MKTMVGIHYENMPVAVKQFQSSQVSIAYTELFTYLSQLE